MSRMIDADALAVDIKECIDAKYDNCEYEQVQGLETALECIDEQPTAVPERKTGRWIDYVKDGYVECPFCHSATNCDDNISDLHFCFSCGAMMEGEG